MEHQVGAAHENVLMLLPNKGSPCFLPCYAARQPYKCIRIMDAFVAMRNYIMTTSTMTAELSEIRAKLTLLERADEDNAEAVNDLSEDMRKELDNIYEAIAALSVKVPKARKQPRPIGFKQSK